MTEYSKRMMAEKVEDIFIKVIELIKSEIINLEPNIWLSIVKNLYSILAANYIYTYHKMTRLPLLQCFTEFVDHLERYVNNMNKSVNNCE